MAGRLLVRRARRYVLMGFFDSDRTGGVLAKKLEKLMALEQTASLAASALPACLCTSSAALPWTQHLRARCV